MKNCTKKHLRFIYHLPQKTLEFLITFFVRLWFFIRKINEILIVNRLRLYKPLISKLNLKRLKVVKNNTFHRSITLFDFYPPSSTPNEIK